MNLQELKSNFETEKEQQNQARLNLETLLHQEQVILSNLKDEYSILKEEYELQKNEATQQKAKTHYTISRLRLCKTRLR